jgi:hypothetical protein
VFVVDKRKLIVKINKKWRREERVCVKCCGKQIKWRWNREERVVSKDLLVVFP